MLDVRFYGIRTILCLGAHADDIEIGCGGTLLDLVARHPDATIYWVVFSAVERRAAEAIRSTEGVLAGTTHPKVIIKDFHDTVMPYQGEQIKAFFSELASRVEPDIIFTHRREDMHQDHRLISEPTWCTFRSHLIVEYEIPKYEGDLGTPNLFVPLSEATCRRKVESILEVFES